MSHSKKESRSTQASRNSEGSHNPSQGKPSNPLQSKNSNSSK